MLQLNSNSEAFNIYIYIKKKCRLVITWSTLTQVWQHVCTHCDHFFFRSPISLLCSGEIQIQTKRSVLKDKNTITCRRNRSSTSICSCLFLVFVFLWFGLACFSSTKTIRDSNQNRSSVQVVFPVRRVKEWGCHESNQTKPEWV